MKIYHFYTDAGETFFTEEGELITGWHENDAGWRSEYMNKLLEHFGITVLQPPKNLHAKFKKIVKKKLQGLY